VAYLEKAVRRAAWPELWLPIWSTIEQEVKMRIALFVVFGIIALGGVVGEVCLKSEVWLVPIIIGVAGLQTVAIGYMFHNLENRLGAGFDRVQDGLRAGVDRIVDNLKK